MIGTCPFLGDIDGFLEKVLTELKDDGIDASDLELDHICYRVETLERYRELKRELSKQGELVSEAEIRGRPIAVYRLREPIIFKDRRIYCVELPSPKEGTPYTDGLEHVEFVIKDSFSDFMKKHSDVKFETSDITKPVNPDIRIKYEGFSVKFHNKPLEDVVRYERYSP